MIPALVERAYSGQIQDNVSILKNNHLKKVLGHIKFYMCKYVYVSIFQESKSVKDNYA